MKLNHRLTGSIHITTLAVPLILIQFTHIAFSTIDIVMMGWLGPLDIAAGGLALSLFNLFCFIGMGLMMPISNLITAASVDVEYADAEIPDITRASFVLATLAGLIFWCLMIGLNKMLAWLEQDVLITTKASCYLLILAPGILPFLWVQVLRNFMIGLHQSGWLLLIMLISVALKAALNIVLVLGLLVMPPLGLTGIAWSTIIIHLFSFIVLLLSVRCNPKIGCLLSINMQRTRGDTLLRIWWIGLPLAITQGLESGFFAMVALLMGEISVEALAAHNVVYQAVSIALMISIGLSHSASIKVSRACAQKDINIARRLAYITLSIGGSCMMVIAVLYFAFPNQVLHLFLLPGHPDNSTVLTIAKQLLIIAAVLQFFDCSQSISIGILRGLGETSSSSVIALIGYWAVGLPTAWLLGNVIQGGAIGIWIGLTTGLGVTSILLFLRFRYLITSLESTAL
jgi:MATE family multidrug resistance protein